MRVGLIAAFAALAFAAPAHAITPTITEFSTGLSSSDNPFDVATGPDGNLWFTDAGSARAIGRMTTAGTITKFTSGLLSGSSPLFIAAGLDGNLWFTDAGSTPAIGRVDTSGHIVEFTTGLNPGSSPNAIVSGPDGNLWFTDHGATPAIGRVTPSGEIHEFSLPASSSPAGIASGPDGNMWFTDAGATRGIGRITPSGTVLPAFTSGLRAGSVPAQLGAGPDGNVWFTDKGATSAIGRVTPSGTITEFTSGLAPSSSPLGIVSGADGSVWFSDQGMPPAIGRSLTSGAITEFNVGLAMGSRPSGIDAGPDGNVWFADDSGSTPAIGRITTPPAATTAGAVATGSTTAAILGIVDGHAQPTTFHVEYGVVGGNLASTNGRNLGTTSGATHVAAALSRLRPGTTYRVRVVGVNPTDATAGDFLTFTTGPPADRIIGMKLRPKMMVAASSGGPVRPAHAARGTGAIVSYTGTQPATTNFTIEHSVVGRRQGKNCVRRTRRNRSHRPCSLLMRVGSFKHNDPVGRVRFRFTARIHGHKLPPGNYRLDAEPQSAGGIGHTVRKSFSVKLPPRKRGKR